ncbi:MAG: PsbP-related protein [Lachnospiraceae bacterium]|nr:PsbP-related protein [Lachnospiraceae bacterium]
MFCPKCGEKVLDGAEFCQKCGAKLIKDASAQSATSNPASLVQPIGKTPAVVQKKKKSKKVFIILAIVFAFIVILIAANSGDIEERGEQAEKDEEYINSQQDSTNVKLSETYTNKEDGISFQYPSAWVPVNADQYGEWFNDSQIPLVVLANENEDIPENNTYVLVSKFEASQEDVEYLFGDDEEFAKSFKNDAGTTSGDDLEISETSVVELDRVPARMLMAASGDTGFQVYFYFANSNIYRVEFCWAGENPGNNQRFFDAIIDSYKITAVDTGEIDSANAGQSAADQLVYNGIPVDTIMEMKAEDLIAAFGEADEYSDENFVQILSEDGERLVAMANFDSAGYVSYFAGDPEKFELNGQDLNHDYDKLVKIFGREPDYEETFDLLEVRWFFDGYSILLGLDEDGLPGKTEIWKDNAMDYEGSQAELDPELMGRWRAYDGNALILNDNGTVSEVFSFWNSRNRKPDSVAWEASNGRLILTAIYNTEYKYALGEGKRRINGEDVVTDELNLDRSRIPEASEYGYYYREKTGSTDLTGTWIHNDSKGLGGNIEFYADGTGMIGDNPLTWYADESNLYYTAEQKAAFDYTVSGDVLTIFFSDGSRMYTKIGN